ncbi:2-dehydro-3-deoxygluconate kinase [Grimontia indica]|uniref:2-dehydro-3-deoxygluconokinase n=1 Tax=Grimontia indica TaxID=1056512 RepID=R1IZP6_9GAMM|nr:sugar kinase [Grimontia indica]EOD80855.1 2-dehydro-3-deoxygluconate kinase [Grimontia indica]
MEMNKQSYHVALVGECMVELSGEPLSRSYGGDTLNTALYLSRLLSKDQVTVSYATALGEDAISDEMQQNWQSEGIATGLVSRLPGKMPGLYLVETDPQGERTFHYWRSDSAAKRYFDDISPLEKIIKGEGLDLLYFSGISVAILPIEGRNKLLSLIHEARRQGTTIVFDNNYRPRLWQGGDVQDWYGECLRVTDLALITQDDDEAVWGDQDIATRCQAFGCQEVVIKRGAEPCSVVTDLQSAEPRQFSIAGESVERVVDTCAAGDSFAAGYLAGYIKQWPIPRRVALAHKLAATVIQYPGAVIEKSAMPDTSVFEST